MIGDEAFPLRPNLLRPYPGRDLNTMTKKRYNYRLSRARRVVENTFGILTNWFRVLFTTIDADAAKATSIVRACCVLHNMLLTVHDNVYLPAGFADNVLNDGNVAGGFWRANRQNLEGMAATARRHVDAATAARNRYAEWFSAQGAVDWQDQHVNRRRWMYGILVYFLFLSFKINLGTLCFSLCSFKWNIISIYYHMPF